MSEYYKKNLKYKQTSYKKYMQSVSKKNKKNVDYTKLHNTKMEVSESICKSIYNYHSQVAKKLTSPIRSILKTLYMPSISLLLESIKRE